MQEEVKNPEVNEEETPVKPEEAEEVAAEETQDAPGEEAPAPKKGFFKDRGDKKLREAEEKLKAAEEETARLKDQLLRSQAEFQTFRRRNSSVYAEAYAKGVEETLKAMLPVLDNLERALAAVTEKTPLSEGVEMILRQFVENASRMGLEEVPALGETFDPEKHDAVITCPSETPGIILEVFQKGYKVKDKIIRHPMVKVGTEE